MKNLPQGTVYPQPRSVAETPRPRAPGPGGRLWGGPEGTGAADPLLTSHELYGRLGRTATRASSSRLRKLSAVVSYPRGRGACQDRRGAASVKLLIPIFLRVHGVMHRILRMWKEMPQNLPAITRVCGRCERSRFAERADRNMTNWLDRISFKTICGIAGIPAAIIVTMLFGGSPLQLMLAPVGGLPSELVSL